MCVCLNLYTIRLQINKYLIPYIYYSFNKKKSDQLKALNNGHDSHIT